MILNTSFFAPVGNCFQVAYSNTSATITIPVSDEVWNNVRITNTSGNTAFIQISTTNPGNINHPTAGASGSTDVVAIPTGLTSFINTGITSPANVYISTISIAGSGSVFLQTGSFI